MPQSKPQPWLIYMLMISMIIMVTIAKMTLTMHKQPKKLQTKKVNINQKNKMLW